MSEIRYALRSLIKRPGPTLVVVATLGVAIASATVIYSVIDVVWHFIPAVNQDRLVYVASTDTRVVQAEGGSRSVVLRTPASIPDLADWRARSSTFEQLDGIQAGLGEPDWPRRAAARHEDRGDREPARRVGPHAGTRSRLSCRGRFGRIGAGDAALAPVLAAAVLGTPWRARTTRDCSTPCRTPSSASFLPKLERASSVTQRSSRRSSLDPLRRGRDVRDVIVTGRLKPGVVAANRPPRSSTRSRVNCVPNIPTRTQQIGASVLPLVEASGFNVRILLTILSLIGLLVVVVACANVASVIVAQSMARRHELAVHAALGATRADRIRQLMIESAIVSAAGRHRRAHPRRLGHRGAAMAWPQRVRLRRHADERTRLHGQPAHRVRDASRLRTASRAATRAAGSAGTARRHTCRRCHASRPPPAPRHRRVAGRGRDDPDGPDRPVHPDDLEAFRHRIRIRAGAGADVPRRPSFIAATSAAGDSDDSSPI